MDWGMEAARRLDDIAMASEPGAGVTRLPFTPEHRRAKGIIEDWMRAAGLSVRMDAAGTLIGRREGPEGAPTLLVGSHQDSVRHGGAFDGIMGVALGCLALEKLARDGVDLPLAVEVLAFADEEGVRFPTALIGPRALAGTFDPAVLEMTDRTGVRLHNAAREFGADPDGIAALARDPATVAGYLEAHIEQGPVLEAEGRALGVVTGICGIERNRVIVTGRTGHAGTVPMAGRADALVAAARLVTEVHDLACATDGVRATVGALDIAPNVVNSIPDRVEMTIEARSVDDGARQRFMAEVGHHAAAVARRNGTSISIEPTYAQPAVACDADLSGRLEAAVAEVQGASLRLPSGATHDASAMADLCPIAMLFVRCRAGISHSPEEHADPSDLGVAVEAMARCLANVGTLDHAASQ